jgi:ribosome-associated toxin RatA of RatAB toxin-antitoxin module
MAVGGERSIEIGAPIDRCYAIAADIARAPQWQPALTDVEVLTRDAEGRAATADTAFDARVRALRVRLRFAYAPPSSITWDQERGDVKSLHGWWRFEDLGGGRTRATYGLDVDPGRMLGLLLRGPTEGKVRDYLLGGAVDGLKARAESS